MKLNPRTHIGGFIAVSMLLLSSIVSAKTVISSQDCDITVTMAVSFYGKGVSERQVKWWVENTQRMWNGPNGFRVYGECQCKVHFRFLGFVVKDKESCLKDTHCIEVVEVRPGERKRSSVSAEGIKPGEGFFGEPDGPYGTSASGTFCEDDHWIEVAHEFGHLMGLDDEYFNYDVGYTVNADGSITINSMEITYPSSLSERAGDANFQKKVKEKLRKQNQTAGNYQSSDYTAMPSSLGLSVMVDSNVVRQEHINLICKNMKVSCPDKCCCGNSRLDLEKGEECDKMLPPTSCPGYTAESGLYCSGDCKCMTHPTTTTTTTLVAYTVFCGDGRVHSSEKCDPGNPSKGIKGVACEKGSCVNCRCVYCGNNRVESGEQCEPPTTEPCPVGKYCDKTCRWAKRTVRCGDGCIDTPYEECEKNSDCRPDEKCCPEECKCYPK